MAIRWKKIQDDIFYSFSIPLKAFLAISAGIVLAPSWFSVAVLIMILGIALAFVEPLVNRWTDKEIEVAEGVFHLGVFLFYLPFAIESISEVAKER